MVGVERDGYTRVLYVPVYAACLRYCAACAAARRAARAARAARWTAARWRCCASRRPRSSGPAPCAHDTCRRHRRTRHAHVTRHTSRVRW